MSDQSHVEAEILRRHPLYSRTDSTIVRQLAAQRTKDERIVRGIVGFFEQRRGYVFRDWVQCFESSNTFTRRTRFFMLSGLIDGRSCEFCEHIDGRVISVDDPQLIEWAPPYCISCRTSQIGMTEAQVRERGYEPLDKTAEQPPKVDFCDDWVFYHNWSG